MKKIICVIACSVILITLSGCIRNSENNTDGYIAGITENIINGILSDIMGSLDDYDDKDTAKRQEIRVFSARDNSELQTITDNKIILEYMKNTISFIVQEIIWSHGLSTIPDDAAAIYTYELWQEDLDSNAGKEAGPLLKLYDAVLYKDSDGYYLSIKLTDVFMEGLKELKADGQYFVALSNASGKYFSSLTEGSLPLSVSEDDDVDGLSEEPVDFADFYTEARSDIDYEGVAKVSRHQKIEIISAGQKEPSLVVTDLNDIVELLQSECAGEWQYISGLPADAEKICDIIRYAETRHTFGKKLTEQYRDVLYSGTDGYYMETVTAYTPLNPATDEWESLCFKVPDDVGGYFKSLCNQ